MSPVTLQKKLSGNAPTSVNDLALIAGAIPGTDAGAIIETAVAQHGGYERLLSDSVSAPAATATDQISSQDRAQH
ncbi:hypothetical protein [Rhodoglobus sp.]